MTAERTTLARLREIEAAHGVNSTRAVTFRAAHERRILFEEKQEAAEGATPVVVPIDPAKFPHSARLETLRSKGGIIADVYRSTHGARIAAERAAMGDSEPPPEAA